MSVSEQITRIQSDKSTIRNQLVAFGLVESNADLDDLDIIMVRVRFQAWPAGVITSFKAKALRLQRRSRMLRPTADITGCQM